MKRHVALAIALFFLAPCCIALTYQYLYAPWRAAHYTKQNTLTCVFCDKKITSNEEAALILRRFNHNIILINPYPYNYGHLLIAPLEHVAHLEDLSFNARTELMELITHGTVILKNVLGAEAVNVGINLGRAAGASFPAHVHVHLVPRWASDVGFLETIAETKLIYVELKKAYEHLKPSFSNLTLQSDI